MRIVRLQAEGFKRLVAVDITPEGDLIEIRGNNGEGKSSVLDAIFAALAGADGAPIKPVRTGEEYALIKLDLGELKVTRFFDPDGTTKLKVENGEGAVFSEGQTMLNKLVGSIAFDPLEFAGMDPKTQAAELRKLVKLDVDLDALKKADAVDYEARRDMNRDALALKGRIEAIVVPADTPDEAPDVAGLTDELASAGETNAAIDRHNRDREDRQAVIDRRKEHAIQMRDQSDEYRRQADVLDSDRAIVEKGTAEREAELSAIPVRTDVVDVSALRQRLAEADSLSRLVARKLERAKLAGEFAQLKSESDGLSQLMKDRAKAREDALSSAAMPVPGLSFADFDGDLIVTLDGEPFSQASGAQQLRTSVAVAMAANPKLRILRVKDGSLLDAKNLAVLREVATANDFQIWGEFVGEEGAGIIMEAGRVKGAADPEPLPAPKRRAKSKAEAPVDVNAVPAEVVPAGSLL